MNVTTEHANGIAIVRVGETRLMYPMLSEFSAAVQRCSPPASADILIDLSPVTYVDSATIGCLMDLYRQASAAGGRAEALRRPEARRDDADDDRRAELHRDPRRRAERRQELRGVACAPSRRRPAQRVTLDGDLLAVMEALYKEVTARRELESHVRRHGARNPAPHRADDGRGAAQYLSESLFLNTVTYENDKLEAYMKKLTEK